MLKKFLIAFASMSAAVMTGSGQSIEGPYKDPVPNVIYQLLFCDNLRLFKEQHKGPVEQPWTELFSKKPDYDVIAKIAADKTNEARIRMLAFNALRAAGEPVPRKEYLGTIIEVQLPEGLDTLAVFMDGGARYINHSGKMSIVEGAPNPFSKEIKAVIDASKPIVTAIGPWDKERLPPPMEGNIRMTFLVSDGLYFGEGPMEVMQKEKLAAPLISAVTRLLVKLVEKTTTDEAGREEPETSDPEQPSAN